MCHVVNLHQRNIFSSAAATAAGRLAILPSTTQTRVLQVRRYLSHTGAHATRLFKGSHHRQRTPAAKSRRSTHPTLVVVVVLVLFALVCDTLYKRRRCQPLCQAQPRRHRLSCTYAHIAGRRNTLYITGALYSRRERAAGRKRATGEHSAASIKSDAKYGVIALACRVSSARRPRASHRLRRWATVASMMASAESIFDYHL